VQLALLALDERLGRWHASLAQAARNAAEADARLTAETAALTTWQERAGATRETLAKYAAGGV
jgi:hypothetical protein